MTINKNSNRDNFFLIDSDKFPVSLFKSKFLNKIFLISRATQKFCLITQPLEIKETLLNKIKWSGILKYVPKRAEIKSLGFEFCFKFDKNRVFYALEISFLNFG